MEKKGETLGLAMIVKDEEKTLGKCLESVKGLFDEIVIADTGSQDKTKEIAASFGAKVVEFEWIDDFAAARNFAFSNVTSTFVMWLDADDVVEPADKELLEQLKQRLEAEVDCYHLKYNVAKDEFGNVTFSYFRERIIRNTGEAKWAAPIHEVMIVPEKWKRSFEEIAITHSPPPDKHTKDPQRNVRLLKKAIKKFPDDRRLRYYYARDLLTAGKTQEAITRFEEYLTGEDWHENRVNAHLHLGSAYQTDGDTDKAIRAYLRGINLDPRWAEFPMAIGRIYYDLKEWGKAIFWFEIASRCTIPKTQGFVQVSDYTWEPHDRLCVCYWQIGEREKSYEANEKAVVFRPLDKRLQANRDVMRNLMFPERRAERPFRISFNSSGPRPGYPHRRDLSLDPKDLIRVPYEDRTVHAIYSDLSRFAGRVEASEAMREYGRILRHNGDLVLDFVDLKRLCEGTLAGKSEFHAFSSPTFTKEELESALEEGGFKTLEVTESEKDGLPFGTLRATQKRNPLKVRWLLSSEDQDDHAFRIRVLNIHRFLVERGIDSELVHIEKDTEKLFENLRCGDVVVLTSYGTVEKDTAERLRRCGIPVIFEMSHRMAEVDGFHETLWSASKIVCPSEAWNAVAGWHTHSLIIPDAYEAAPNPADRTYGLRGEDGKARVLWCGSEQEFGNVEPIVEIMGELELEFVSLSKGEKAHKEWMGSTWIQELADADMVVLPERHWIKAEAAKSGFRATQVQALGIPVLVSPIAAYTDTLKDGESGFVCNELEDWKNNLKRLRDDAALRESIGRKGAAAVRGDRSIEAIGERWIKLLEEVSTGNCAPPEVDIVIPTFNNFPYLKLTIESLRRTTEWPCRLIVVDSGADESAEWLRQQRDVTHIRSETRMHFAQAVNAGMAASKAPYVCLLNDDILLSENWLPALMAEAIKPRTGLIGPISNSGKGMFHEEKLEVSGKELTVRMSVEDISDIIPQIESFKHRKLVYERFWVPFFAVVIPRVIMEKVGPLDENFRNGWEDGDYCNRARKLGFAVRDTQDAFVFHFTEKTRYRYENEDEYNRTYYDKKVLDQGFEIAR